MVDTDDSRNGNVCRSSAGTDTASQSAREDHDEKTATRQFCNRI